MAKNDKNLDKALSDAIDDTLKDWRKSMTNAVDFAIDRAQFDWMNEAKNCLSEYYKHEPDVYQRVYINGKSLLEYSFVPYKKVKYGTKKVTGSVGVEYDASALEAYIGDPVTYVGEDGIIRTKHVGYYGSAKHQPVDAWWVIENYLMGLHPDGGADRSSFNADSESPNSKMQRYKKEYQKIFDENVLLGLLGQIAKKMS